ncbi:MAG: phosphotransferase family protein [Anaerolineae bacterium]|nr:phosphotransferase family protein [Anaerolineae bacterium]
MPAADDKARFERLIQRIEPGSRLLRAWSLTGGVTAQMASLEVERADGTTVKWVARRYGDVDPVQGDYVAVGEFKLLCALQVTGLPVPPPIAYDPPEDLFDPPTLVLGYLEGAPQFAAADVSAFMRQLAAQLAQIHRLDVTALNLAFLPRQAEVVSLRLRRRPQVFDESMGEGPIRAALDSVWPLASLNPPALLHGDFWPGNVLWQNNRIAAVIDWEDAAVGDPLADLANTRLELLWAFGAEAMRSFTREYEKVMPGIDARHLPYWDLCAALRPIDQIGDWGLDETVERMMRERHRVFVAEALRAIGAR